jgi:hypothetical protein
MSRKLEHLLREWGAFHIKHLDAADEWGTNILYGAQLLQGKVQYGRSGHKILCVDTPRHLQAVDIAVNRLPFAQKGPVVMYYCAPLKEDGNPYSLAEIAFLLYKRKGCVRKLKEGVRVGRIKLEFLAK